MSASPDGFASPAFEVFFSQDCDGCGHPVLPGPWANGAHRWMAEAVALHPGGSVAYGRYDGRGSLNRFQHAIGEAQVFHVECWCILGRPTTFVEVSRMSDDDGSPFADPLYRFPRPSTLSDLETARARNRRARLRVIR